MASLSAGQSDISAIHLYIVSDD